MLRIARQAGVAERIETTTNASLLTRDLAQELVDLRLDYLRVSIYATTQERHKEVTGSRMPLQAVHENLRVLRDVKRASRLRAPVRQLQDDRRLWRRERAILTGVRRCRRRTVHRQAARLDQGGVEPTSSGPTTRARPSRSVRTCCAGSASRVACPMAFTTMAVRSNGDVVALLRGFHRRHQHGQRG